MDALPARHQLTHLQTDALLSLSEQLAQLERRFDAQGIVSDDNRLQEAVRVAVADQVNIFAHRIEAMEALMRQFENEIEKLKVHVFPINWDAFLAKRRAEQFVQDATLRGSIGDSVEGFPVAVQDHVK